MSSKNSKAIAQAAETISANCLAGRVRLLHRTITGIYQEALRPLGLTDAQLTILVMVANRGPVTLALDPIGDPPNWAVQARAAASGGSSGAGVLLPVAAAATWHARCGPSDAISTAAAR